MRYTDIPEPLEDPYTVNLTSVILLLFRNFTKQNSISGRRGRQVCLHCVLSRRQIEGQGEEDRRKVNSADDIIMTQFFHSHLALLPA